MKKEEDIISVGLRSIKNKKSPGKCETYFFHQTILNFIHLSY